MARSGQSHQALRARFGKGPAGFQVVNVANGFLVVVEDEIERQWHPKIEHGQTLAVDVGTDGQVGAEWIGGQGGPVTAAEGTVLVRVDHLAAVHIEHGQSS